MAGIFCRSCQEKKLSNEMAHYNVSVECDHPPLICLRCIIVETRNIKRCPFPLCGTTVDKENVNSVTKRFENAFVYLFGNEALSLQILTIESCTGDKIKVEYRKDKTVSELIQDMTEELTARDVMFVHSGIRFCYNGIRFDDQQGRATLEGIGVKPPSTIYMQLVHLKITEELQVDVKFSLTFSQIGEERLKEIQMKLQEEENKIKEKFKDMEEPSSSYSHLPPEAYVATVIVANSSPELSQKRAALTKLSMQLQSCTKENILHGTCFLYHGRDIHDVLYHSAKSKNLIKFSSSKKFDNDGKLKQECQIPLDKLSPELTAIVFVHSINVGYGESITDVSFLKSIEFSLMSKRQSMWVLSKRTQENMWKFTINENKLSQCDMFPSIIVGALVREGTGWNLIYSGKPCSGSLGYPDSPGFLQLQHNVDKFVKEYCSVDCNHI